MKDGRKDEEEGGGGPGCGKSGGAHLVTIRVEKGFKVDDVGM